MILLLIILVGLSGCIFAAPGHAAEDGLHLILEAENPLLSLGANGKLNGAMAERMTAFTAASPIAISMDRNSWTRGLADVQSNNNTCLALIARTVEREPLYTWVGPFGQRQYGLFALQSRNLKAASFDDIARQNLRVGTVANEASDSLIKIDARLLRDAVTDSILNARKLAAGRIDLWASSVETAQKLSAQVDSPPIVQVMGLPDLEISMACNKSTSPDWIATLNKVLRDLPKPASR